MSLKLTKLRPLFDMREPILLRSKDPLRDHEPIHLRHLNVSHHEPIHIPAAVCLNFELVEFDSCSAAADAGGLNFEIGLQHALKWVQVENIVVY